MYGTAINPTELEGFFGLPIVARFSDDLREWSDHELPVFDPMRERAYGVYMHMPGKDNMLSDPASNPLAPDVPGWSYGAFLLPPERFSTWNFTDRILTVHYLLSFGSPYQTHIMRTVIRLPV
jgi:hypothetical protein